MSYKVRTQAFTGPFDLLLSLVSRQKVDISTISISEVADQYLAEMERIRELDLDVASDFVLVASTLLEMKASSLVANGDEALREINIDDMDAELDGLSADEAREVLIARLFTYKQFRGAAASLGARMEAESRMHPRTAGPDPEFLGLMPDFLEGITLRSLSVICADLDSRREEFLLEAEHIAPRRKPVHLAVESVQRLLRDRGTSNFSELVGEDRTPETLVVTFLALLELFKRGSVRLEQKDNFAEIDITYLGEGDTPTDAIDSSDLDAYDSLDGSQNGEG